MVVLIPLAAAIWLVAISGDLTFTTPWVLVSLVLWFVSLVLAWHVTFCINSLAHVWGKRRFAYPIKHKLEGIYVVHEISTPASNLDETDRFLRLADEVVRHKIVRLPDHEATRRGLLGQPAAG